MAVEWIKIEVSTADKPEILKISRILGLEKDAVFGKLIRLWAWFNRNSVDGVVDGIVDSDVDEICNHVGFSSACISVGWLSIDFENEKVTIPNFARHNGESAKNRALKTERQSKWRLNKSTSPSTTPSTSPSTSPSTREEKRREDIKPSMFDNFWEAYPKKTGKGAAETAWKKIKSPADTLLLILSALSKQKTSDQWRKDGGQFIPNPATYLNQRRWEDEISSSEAVNADWKARPEFAGML